MTAEKNNDWTLQMDNLHYVFEFEKKLKEMWHQVWHSLQSGIKDELYKAFEKSFASNMWYDLGMNKEYELIEEFRDNQNLWVVWIGKVSDDIFLKSTGMNLECEYYSNKDYAKLMTILPTWFDESMNNWNKVSSVVLRYHTDINDSKTIDQLITLMKPVIEA